MIPNNIIDDIRERADIVSVISEYVQLKKRGKNYLGLCPFHSEKTPSFTVSAEKKLFHCFGCGEGGNIFTFIMKAENVGFAEAAKMLGDKLGVNVPDAYEGKDVQGRGEKLLETVRFASEFFQKTLEGPRGGEARSYLEKRKISDESIKAFKLGFTTEEWDALSKYLIQRGVHPKDIEEAGLSLPKDGGGSFDRFRARLMFPISDARARVVGFGGRLIKDGEPKYINSPETSIYHKSRIVYGLDLSRDHIKKENVAVVVEGYMDVIACYQAGIKNVVASMGTALTEDQAKLLQRYTRNIVLAYDSDLAGAAATERGVELLKKMDLNIRIAPISGAKDPDELVRAKGADALKEIIRSALPWLEYKIYAVLSRFNLEEIEPRARAIREISALISREPDRLIRAEYIKLAAAKIKANPEAIASEVKRESYYSDKGSSSDMRRRTEKPAPKILKAEKAILKLAVENKNIRDMLKENIHWGEFTEGLNRTIAEALYNESGAEGDISSLLIDKLPTDEARKALSAMLVVEQPGETDERMINDYIGTIKAHHLRSRITVVRSELEEAEKNKEIERAQALHKEFSDLSSILRTFERTV